MLIDDLHPLAVQNVPAVVFAGATPTDQMLAGFQEARKRILALIPAGYQINYDAAVSTSNGFTDQVEQRKQAVQNALLYRQDLAEQDSLTTTTDNSRDYWLSQYRIASEGIGAYAMGAAQQAVSDRRISQIEYNDGVDQRIKVFQSIVAADNAGNLGQLVSGESYTQQAVSSSPQGAMMLRSGQIDPRMVGSKLMMTSKGTKVLVPTGGSGAVGLGVDPITIGIFVTIGVLALVAGVVYYAIEKKRMEQSAAFMAQFCNDALKTGNKSAIDACIKFGDNLGKPKSAADTLLGGKMQDYLIWGGVALAGIYFAPMIVQSAIGVQGAIVKRNRRRR
jgi:hypothetical protein